MNVSRRENRNAHARRTANECLRREKSLCGLLLIFIVTTFTACSSTHKDAAVEHVRLFLTAAASADYTRAAEYATPAVMSNLGWDDARSEELKAYFLSSLEGDADVELMLRDSDTSAAVDDLVAKLSKDVLYFTVNAESYREDDGVAQVAVTVSRMSDSAVSEVYGELAASVLEEASTVGEEVLEEHPEYAELESEELYARIYQTLLPKLVPTVDEQMSELQGEEERWIVELSIGEEDAIEITGIYAQ